MHGELSESMSLLCPSESELYFVCENYGRDMEFPIRWDDKEGKLQTEKVTNLNL